MSKTLRNCRLVGHSSDELFDVQIQSGKIHKISESVESASGDDMQGRWLQPGLQDAHVHFSTWSLSSGRLDLSSAKDGNAAMGMIAEHAQKNADDSPIIAVRCAFSVWQRVLPELSRKALDKAVPDRVLVLISADLHTCWCNTRALETLGWSSADTDGHLKELDCFAATEKVAKLQAREMDAFVRQAVDAAAAKGVTSIIEFEMAPNIEVWLERVNSKSISLLRVFCNIYPAYLDTLSKYQNVKTGTPIPGGRDLIHFGFFKMIADGALGTISALCHQPYLNTPKVEHGQSVYTPEELLSNLRQAISIGLTPAIHAIGDKAISLVLDSYSQLDQPLPAGTRIEHAQLIANEDIPRMASLGVTASVQPRHLVDDRPLCAHHWSDRSERTFPLKSYEEAGVRMVMGSDAPVAPLDPWETMASAISRHDAGETESWHAEQLIDIKVAHAASTWSGSSLIKVGQLADLCVTDSNPLESGESGLRSMKVYATLLNGDYTYQRGS